MDCLNFRRQLLESPLRNEPQLLAHEQDCPTCAEFARRIRSQEARLRAVLNVAPPPELAERIQLAVSFEPRRSLQQRRWLSMAAGLLLVVSAVSVSWYLSPLERRSLELADSVLHHVHDELQHMHEINHVGQRRLAQLFGAFGAQLHADLGPVNFAAECLMRKKNGVHLVLPGQHGPVTVFFMPDETPTQILTVADQRFRGQVVPTAWGSLAVVGEHGEVLDGIAERLLQAVDWPARISQAAHLGALRPPRA